MTATEGPRFCPGCGRNLVAEKPIELGALTFEPHGFIWWHDQVARVTAAQHELLAGLVHAGGAIVRRSILAERIGNDTDGNVVEVLMSRLRRALRDVGAPADVIQTWPRRGYRLNLEALQCQ